MLAHNGDSCVERQVLLTNTDLYTCVIICVYDCNTDRAIGSFYHI